MIFFIYEAFFFAGVLIDIRLVRWVLSTLREHGKSKNQAKLFAETKKLYDTMKFRPCIDLHQGVVKQIVGGSLNDSDIENPVTNFTGQNSAGWYAELYRKDGLLGGHMIRLGPGNDDAMQDAFSAWPEGIQLGGGVTADNAADLLKAGAAKLIVTSYVFNNGKVDRDRLEKLYKIVGKEKLVLDLSCRKKEGKYLVVTDRWQNFTEVEVNTESLDFFSQFCSEFLIHAVDVEGKMSGIESDLVRLLGNWGKLPMTYAGGIHSWEDIDLIKQNGKGKIDFTVGSALDLFGGTGLKYKELVERYG